MFIPSDDFALRHLARIVESSDDAILSKNLNGIILSWNAAAEALFGYSAAEAIGQPVRLIIPTERHEEDDLLLERIRRGEAIRHLETLRCTRDGRKVPISLTVSPVTDDAGVVIGASEIARDVSDRLRTDLAVRQLAAVVNSSDDAIVTKDLESTILSWNAAAERMFGYTAAEVIGRSVRLIIPPDRQGEEDYVLSRIRSGDGVPHYETLRLR